MSEWILEELNIFWAGFFFKACERETNELLEEIIGEYHNDCKYFQTDHEKH